MSLIAISRSSLAFERFWDCSSAITWPSSATLVSSRSASAFLRSVPFEWTLDHRWRLRVLEFSPVDPRPVSSRRPTSRTQSDTGDLRFIYQYTVQGSFSRGFWRGARVHRGDWCRDNLCPRRGDRSLFGIGCSKRSRSLNRIRRIRPGGLRWRSVAEFGQVGQRYPLHRSIDRCCFPAQGCAVSIPDSLGVYGAKSAPDCYGRART